MHRYGQSIGSEVTAESSPTKYQFSWDSHGAVNGTYTLTAIARDAAGKHHLGWGGGDHQQLNAPRSQTTSARDLSRAPSYAPMRLRA